MRIPTSDEHFLHLRERMVEVQLRRRGITDPRVLDAMLRVPRHEFVPADLREFAYEDRPLPLTDAQTISQPYIVALMTELARPEPTSRVLEIGVGSAYQTAILAELCEAVWGIEIVASLADTARSRLEQMGYRNVNIRHGDGYAGWPDEAPFDIILVAAAPPYVPPPLLDQLAPRGRLILPVGNFEQYLTVIGRGPAGELEQHIVTPVAFVPMTGEVRRRRAE